MKRCKMTIHSTCSQCDKVCHNEAHLEQRKKTHSEGVTCDVCKKASSTKFLGWNKRVNICTRSLIQLKDLTKVLEIRKRDTGLCLKTTKISYIVPNDHYVLQ